MLKNWKTATAAVALSATMFGAGAIYTSGAHAKPFDPPGARWELRGERGSARNLNAVRRHIEVAIDQLQRDQFDFGGHREAAIDLLQQAHAQIIAAMQWDATQPH